MVSSQTLASCGSLTCSFFAFVLRALTQRCFNFASVSFLAFFVDAATGPPPQHDSAASPWMGMRKICWACGWTAKCAAQLGKTSFIFILRSPGSSSCRPAFAFEAEMSCHSPLEPLPSRPRPLKRRCPATLRSKRDVLPCCLGKAFFDDLDFSAVCFP